MHGQRVCGAGTKEGRERGRKGREGGEGGRK